MQLNLYHTSLSFDNQVGGILLKTFRENAKIVVTNIFSFSLVIRERANVI